MEEKKEETRWVIIGIHGLYVGQWLTRKAAIHDHCCDKGKTWEYCKKNGDRVVKAKISW
jgi:hypothetical protein